MKATSFILGDKIKGQILLDMIEKSPVLWRAEIFPKGINQFITIKVYGNKKDVTREAFKIRDMYRVESFLSNNYEGID